MRFVTIQTKHFCHHEIFNSPAERENQNFGTSCPTLPYYTQNHSVMYTSCLALSGRNIMHRRRLTPPLMTWYFCLPKQGMKSYIITVEHRLSEHRLSEKSFIRIWNVRTEISIVYPKSEHQVKKKKKPSPRH